MKTNLLPIIAFLAALAAIIVLPFGTVASGMTLAVTGLLAVFVADYGRALEPVRIPAEVVPFTTPGRPVALRAAA